MKNKMVSNLKKYPAYKGSGIEWIGEIPEHWNKSKLKYGLKKKITDGPHETPIFIDEGIPFLSVDGIQDGELIFEGCRFVSTKEHNRFSQKCNIEKDDILMGKAASIGKIARVKVDFEFSVWSPLALIKPKKEKVLPIFLEFALKSAETQYQIEILCTSNTQKNISMDDIPHIILLFPPIDEQQAIADYLDKKTALIDKLIDKKKQQIELLKEQRQAVINQVVTKGLDPDVEMKESGIEWLGKIPKHWDAKKLKYVITIKSGDGVSNENIHSEGEYPIYGGNGLLGYTNDFNVDGDTLVVGRVGAKCGNVHLVRGKYWVSDNALVTKTTQDYEFMYFLLTSMNLNNLANQNAQPLITATMVKLQYVALPDGVEQVEIVKHLKLELTKIQEAEDRAKKQIHLLQEYRTALISEAVTGKIDVRREN